MKTYTLTIEVRHYYSVEVDAENEVAASFIGNEMPSLTVAEVGGLLEIETSVTDCEEVDNA